MKYCLQLSLCVFFLIGCSSIQNLNTESEFIPCSQNEVRLEARSNELQAIMKRDQEDRIDWEQKTFEQMSEVAIRDEIRRKRVGEIFAEGCFSKPQDYVAAALVYQHGDTSDHFFQSFIWSRRAVELGDLRQKRMMALALDRYLVSIGYKQLFGSQAFKENFKSTTCFCFQQIEKTFPDKIRKDYTNKTLSEVFTWLNELNSGKNCPKQECERALKDSPKGTVPGFW